MNIFLAPVLFAGVFAAYFMDDSDIDNGNVEMYSQVTHTENMRFIGKMCLGNIIGTYGSQSIQSNWDYGWQKVFKNKNRKHHKSRSER